MSYAANVHVAVYQVLDDVLGQCVAPPGAKAEIHSIIDNLRAGAASRQMVEMAEAISVRLHQLEWARSQGDDTSEQQARQELSGIATAWIDFRIMHQSDAIGTGRAGSKFDVNDSMRSTIGSMCDGRPNLR